MVDGMSRGVMPAGTAFVERLQAQLRQKDGEIEMLQVNFNFDFYFHPSIHLSIHLFIIHLFTNHPSIHPSIHRPSVRPSVHQSTQLFYPAYLSRFTDSHLYLTSMRLFLGRLCVVLPIIFTVCGFTG